MLAYHAATAPRQAAATLNGKAVSVKSSFGAKSVRLELTSAVGLNPGDTLRVEIS